MGKQILQVDEIKVQYSGLPVIHGVSLDVRKGEAVCVVGANGAGKSTILKAIMGSLKVFAGQILFNNKEIQNLGTEVIVRMGVTYVPEERMLFSPLSVKENLLLGAYVVREEKRIQENLEFVYNLFPALREREGQPASTLSGGEQQMVAIGRGLMSNPQLLMLDEPSLGLAPRLVDEVLGTVRRLRETGITILLVEQNVREALEMSDRGYVIQTGQVLLEGSGQELKENEMIRKAYLGL